MGLVGLELVVGSEHDPHVHFPLLHLTDPVAQQDLALWFAKEGRPNSVEGSICLF